MKTYIISLLYIVCLCSCMTQKRVAKWIEKNPELIKTQRVIIKDTISIIDTIEISGDSVIGFFQLDKPTLDTTIVSDSGDLGIWLQYGTMTDGASGAGSPNSDPKIITVPIKEIIRETKYIKVRAESKPDTVYINKEIPVEKITTVDRVVVKNIALWQKVLMGLGYFGIGALAFLIFFLVRKR